VATLAGGAERWFDLLAELLDPAVLDATAADAYRLPARPRA
jgi:hypothetical protein